MSEVEWLEIFSDNLKDMMKERDYTQASLAKELGVTQSTISRYLNGTQIPTIKAIVNMTYAFSCTAEDLICFGDRIE